MSTDTETEDPVIVRTDFPQEEPAPRLPATIEEAKAERERRAEYRPEDHSAGLFFDAATMDHMLRVATLMAKASLIPESLCFVGTGNNKVALPFQTVVANCFLIVNQARLWKIDAFALAQSSSVVHGRLMIEGKAIAAVLEATRGIRLRYEWNALQGDSFGITATERDLRDGESERRSVSGTVGAWKTKKKGGVVSDNWTGPAARQQLAYRAAREWARLHEPGLVLGVLAGDDAEHIAQRLDDEKAAADPVMPMGSGFRNAPEVKPSIKARQRARKPRFPQADPVTSSQDGPGAAEGPAAAEAARRVEKAAERADVGPADPFAIFLEEHLPVAQSWADIADALTALSTTPDWGSHFQVDPRRGGDFRIQEAYRRAWLRCRALMAASKGAIEVSLTHNMQAFRCFLEAQNNPTLITQTFEAIKQEETWQAMDDGHRYRLECIVEARLEEAGAGEES